MKPCGLHGPGRCADGRERAELPVHLLGIQNTRINYMYRDASNYKQVGRVVFGGTISADEKGRLIAHLDEGHYFIAEQVGLENLRERWETHHVEDDHIWHEIDEPATDIAIVDEPPTEEVDIHLWVEIFCATEWDEAAAGERLDSWFAEIPDWDRGEST